MKSINRIKKTWIWVLLTFLALAFLSFNLGRPKSWNPSSRILIEILAPVQKLIKYSVDSVGGLWDKYIGLIGIHEENIRLKSAISHLTMENSKYRELLSTHKRLQQLLNFKNTTEERALAAQVIGRDPSGWFKSINIDKGENSGIKANMPVVHANGVVGQVVSLSYNYSNVLLLIDQNSAVDCIIARSRDSGIVRGISSKVCVLDNVLKTSDVRIGDEVITSGLGRVFPKGLSVGEVIEVRDTPGELFKSVMIRPSVDFSKLEEVLVFLREDPLLTPLKEKD